MIDVTADDRPAQALPWAAWRAEYERLMGEAFGRPWSMDETGTDCYDDAFRVGMTPADALSEERSYWED